MQTCSDNTIFGAKLQRTIVVLGFAVATVTTLAVSPARADSDDWRHNGWQQRQERHEWRQHSWRERHEGYRGYNGYNGYYGYYTAPPPVVYGPSPGFSFGFDVR